MIKIITTCIIIVIIFENYIPSNNKFKENRLLFINFHIRFVIQITQFMKTRIQQLLNKENITAATFADTINTQRSSISHVLTGRNNPSLELLQKILKAFPQINADWLLLGEGEMYKQQQQQQQGDLFDTPATKQEITGQERNITPETNKNEEMRSEKDEKITKIVFFFKDNTFTEYSSR